MRVGDAAVWNGAPVELPNGRLMSRALDNRLGAYVVARGGPADRRGEGRRRSTSSRSPRRRRRSAATAREPRRTGSTRRWRSPSTSRLRPTYPGGDARRAGRVELGMGAMIARGPTLNKHVVELLAEAAEAEGIPHAFEVYDARDVDRRRRVPPRARRRPDRAGLDPDALPAHAERALRARRRRVVDPPDRRAARSASAPTRPSSVSALGSLAVPSGRG